MGGALSSQGMAKTRSHTPWSAILEEGRADERLVRTARYGARPARPEPLPGDLHPALLEALERTGVDTLWSHQAAALESAWRGPTIVTTGTASGKSLAFNLPVLDTLARDPRARAIYIYPTKALAQDQARKLHELRAPFLRHAIYDGDTPREERRAIRQRSNLILTNPDMLHVGVLPHHRTGATCWRTSRSWSSTRRTSTAACSARTWRTCCGGCGGSPRPTAPSRASS